MNHTEAESSQAVDRYLLGQMNEPENDSFELHFFECAACAAEVEAGIIFQENAKAAFKGYKPALEPGRITVWLRRLAFPVPAFAALVLAGASIYQQQELARLRAPQGVLAFYVHTPRRAEEPNPPITLPAGTRSFLINLDLPENAAGYPRYQGEFSGPAHGTFEIPAPPPGSPINILISAAGLQPGVYTLRMHGVRGSTTGPEAGYSFQLQLN
jgi:hypothetical protein